MHFPLLASQGHRENSFTWIYLSLLQTAAVQDLYLSIYIPGLFLLTSLGQITDGLILRTVCVLNLLLGGAGRALDAEGWQELAITGKIISKLKSALGITYSKEPAHCLTETTEEHSTVLYSWAMPSAHSCAGHSYRFRNSLWTAELLLPDGLDQTAHQPWEGTVLKKYSQLCKILAVTSPSHCREGTMLHHVFRACLSGVGHFGGEEVVGKGERKIY